MFLKYLAKMDLVLILSKFFRSDRSEAQTFCVPFNNLTGLAVLMESAPGLHSAGVFWSKFANELDLNDCILQKWLSFHKNNDFIMQILPENVKN
jgi:hypothetical protein